MIQEITEDLPYGAILTVRDEGSRVRYVDQDYQIQTKVFGKTQKWFPLWVPMVSQDLLDQLKRALQEAEPEADEIRVVLKQTGAFKASDFFMWAIRFGPK